MKRKLKLRNISLFYVPIMLTISSIGIGFSSWIIATKESNKTTGDVNGEVGDIIQYSDFVNASFKSYYRSYDFIGCDVIAREGSWKDQTTNISNDTSFLMYDRFIFHLINKKIFPKCDVRFRFTCNVEGINSSMQYYLRHPYGIGHDHGWFHRETSKNVKQSIYFTPYSAADKKQSFYIEDTWLDLENEADITFKIYPLNYSLIFDSVFKMSCVLEIFRVTDSAKRG